MHRGHNYFLIPICKCITRDTINAEYGDYISQDKIITKETRGNMKQMLRDIQTGKFAREWVLEKQAGMPVMNTMRRLESQHPIETVGEQLRNMMPWLKSDIEKD